MDDIILPPEVPLTYFNEESLNELKSMWTKSTDTFESIDVGDGSYSISGYVYNMASSGDPSLSSVNFEDKVAKMAGLEIYHQDNNHKNIAVHYIKEPF